jgi:Family of unknown function (DUF5947)
LATTRGSSRLRRLAQAPRTEGAETQEHCELCSAPIPSDHRHLLDLGSRELMCCCVPCKILFDRDAAGGGHYRLIPDRRLHVPDFELDEGSWEALRIPVDMAFFFHNTGAERVMAFYPSPMGATESLLELRSWEDLERENPILGELEPDVEALLVNRARGARSHWVVPIDDCYELVGLIRTRWRGLTGGKEVWDGIEAFFEDLGRRARSVSRTGTENRTTPRANAAPGAGEEAAWPAS